MSGEVGLTEGYNRASNSVLFYICLDLEEPCREGGEGGWRGVGLREGFNRASTSILFYICLDLEEPCRGRRGGGGWRG